MGVEDGGGDNVRSFRSYSTEEEAGIRQKHLQSMIEYVQREAVGITERFKLQIEGHAFNMARTYNIRELEDILLERVPKGWPEKSKTEAWIYLIGAVQALSAKYEERKREQTGRE